MLKNRFFTKFLSPEPLPFNVQEWRRQPFAERVEMLCKAWAIQGYGAPVAVYIFYILKMAVYVGGWLFFYSFSETSATHGGL